VDVDVLKRRYGPYPMRVEVSYEPDLGLYKQGTTVPYVRASRQEGPGGEVGSFLGADGEVADPPTDRRRKGKGR
jgi:hypothetical protein